MPPRRSTPTQRSRVSVVSWIPLFAWLAAIVVAGVLLGFCGYEITWRARRLHADLRQLQDLGETLARLQHDAATAQQRLARSGLR